MTLRYARHPNVRLTALEGEGVALHLDTRRYFTLNETGLTILEALGEPRTLEELVSVLVEKFAVAPGVASSTAQAFLDHCVAGELVVATGEP